MIYLKLLNQNLNIKRFRKELYYLNEEVRRIEDLIREKKSAKSQLIVRNPYEIKEGPTPESVLGELSMHLMMKNWISKHGKNIFLYNYYMECIQKLCSKHPEEVL